MTDFPWPKPNIPPEMNRREWIEAHDALIAARRGPHTLRRMNPKTVTIPDTWMREHGFDMKTGKHPRFSEGW